HLAQTTAPSRVHRFEDSHHPDSSQPGELYLLHVLPGHLVAPETGARHSASHQDPSPLPRTRSRSASSSAWDRIPTSVSSVAPIQSASPILASVLRYRWGCHSPRQRPPALEPEECHALIVTFHFPR